MKKWFKLLFYLISVVIGVGAVGVWIPIVQMHYKMPGVGIEDVLSHLGTLVVAVALTTLADFQLSKEAGSNPTARLVLYVLALGSTAGGLIALLLPDKDSCLTYALIGSALGAFEWIWVNVSNPQFGAEEANATAAIGGPTPR